MADARTEGTIGQNAELGAAVAVDSLIDAPFWFANKLLGTDIPAPSHLAGKVYQDQTAGLFLDADGNPIDPTAVSDALGTAEDRGGVLDAAAQTAEDIKNHPTNIVPGWVWVAVGVVAVVVVGYYAVTAASAVKHLAKG